MVNTHLTEKRATVFVQITLMDGESHRWELRKMPRHWNSWTMQQLPYGTKFYGATFQRGRL